jgi:hypothetical protein
MPHLRVRLFLRMQENYRREVWTLSLQAVAAINSNYSTPFWVCWLACATE